MKAVRVLKRGKVRGLHAVHLLRDEEDTVCGIPVDELQVVEDLDLEMLPALEGCGLCRRIQEGWKRIELPKSVGETRVFLEPSFGTIRRTGPLSHGARGHRGSRLRP